MIVNNSFKAIEEKENLIFQQATACSILSESENIVHCSFTTGKMLYYLASTVLAYETLKNVRSTDKSAEANIPKFSN